MTGYLSSLAYCFEYDERVFDYYHSLCSSQNGKYYYDSKRLIKLETISFTNKDILSRVNNFTRHRKSGLFVDINRVYFINDNSLYLWDYSQYNRWCCLNQFSDNIEFVQIAKPKPSIFVTEVQFILIVAVGNEISIIGLGFSNGLITGEIEAFPTQYKIATNNEIVTNIISNPNNCRIFFSTSIGCIYELHYSYHKNLLGQVTRNCYKTNISDSFTKKMFKKIVFPFLFTSQTQTQSETIPPTKTNSKITKEIVDIILHEYSSISWLFCLTKSNLIYGYILSSHSNSKNLEHSDSNTCYKAIEYSSCLQDAQLQLMHIPVYLSQTNTQLVKLNCIDVIESLFTNIILIVFTNCGDRLFLQLIHNPSSSQGLARITCGINQEYKLKLSFIRLRPPFMQLPAAFRRLNGRHAQAQTPAIQFGSPRNVTHCYYRDGLTLYNSRKNLRHCLLLIARDDLDCIQSARSMPQLHESVESSNGEDAGENDIAEIPRTQYVPQLAYLLYNRQQMQIGGKPFVGLTQFAVQHLLPARLFVTVSDLTLTRYKYLRIIDVLENILKQYNLQNQQAVNEEDNAQQQLESFVQHYGVVEIEVMLLTIACCRTPEEMHGIEENEVEQNVQQTDNNSNKLQICIRNRFTTAAQASTLFIQHLIPQFVVQRQNKNPGNYHQRFGSSTIFAAYLWLSRMLRPIWYYTLVIPNIRQTKNASANNANANDNKNLVRSRFTSNEIKCIMQPLSNGLKLLTQASNDWSNNHVYFNQQQREFHCTELMKLIECVKYCIQVLNVWSIVCYSESNFQFVYNLLVNTDSAVNASENQQTIFENIQFQNLVFSNEGKSLMKSIVVAIISKFNVQEARDLHHRCPLLFSLSDYLTFVASNEINEYARNMGNNNGGDNNGLTVYLKRALQKYKAAVKDNLMHFDLQTACHTLREARFFVGTIDLALYVRQLSEIASNTNVNINVKNKFLKKQTECESQIFVVLSELLDSSSTSNPMANENKFVFEKILVRLLKEKQQDMPFLFHLYQFFLEQNCIDKLFTKQANFLVDFLCNPKDDQQQRNHKLPLLIQFYSRTKQYRRLTKLIHVLSQSTGFSLNQQYQFLDDARAASKCLRQDHSSGNDSFNYNYSDDDQLNALDCEQYFEQSMKLCLIQIRVANKIQTIVNNSNNKTPVAASATDDCLNIQSQLLNVEPIYELCREYNFFDCALDCLSFADDPSMGEISSSCWCALITSGIQKYFDERSRQVQHESVHDDSSWMQSICRLIISQMKLYDLNEQPWIFDHYLVAKELHTHNFELAQDVNAARVNARCIVDLLLQSTVTLQEIINIYWQILNFNNKFKPIEIIICCAYLLQQLIAKQNKSQAQSLSTETIKQALVLCDECLFIMEKHSMEANSLQPVLKNLEHFKREFAFANNTLIQNQSRLTFF